MKKLLVLPVVIFFFISGCVQSGQHKGSRSTVPPTVIFEPSDCSYLLSCLNELQGLKKKKFNHFMQESASRLKGGGEKDTLRFICMSMHKKAGYKQARKGEKLLKQYIDEHPDASGDMKGLLTLFRRLNQARGSRQAGNDIKKIIVERDELAKEVENLKLMIKRDQGRILELQSQIDQLKNIENIIKNREH
jgi:hypothetical protein